MNNIYHALPDCVMINDKCYSINTDFRASIAFETMTLDDKIPGERKPLQTLGIYFPQFAEDFSCGKTSKPDCIYLCNHIDDAINTILSFYGGGLPEQVSKRKVKQTARIYDFQHDHAYFYASFLQAYDINLTTVNLHWWDFKALLYALPENTILYKVMKFRGTKISGRMSKEEREYYRRMQQIYALPDRTLSEEEELNDKIAEILAGSGDLSELGG